MLIADEKMLIKTALGTLVAYASDDDDRPGIFIDLRRSGFGVDAPLLCVECDQSGETPVVRTAVWVDVSNIDRSQMVEHMGFTEFFQMVAQDEKNEEYSEEAGVK